MLAHSRLWIPTALLLGACVAPPPVEPLPASITGVVGCEGEQPACILGCNARAYLGRAQCDDGIWRCDGGVRHDLCCDAIYNPDQCPEWGNACAPDHPCADGYTCISSRSWPLPAESGICRLGDWSVPEPLGDCGRDDDLLDGHHLAELGLAAVKVEGVVQVEPICDGKTCSPSDPCCQRCVGSYRLDVAAPDEAPMPVALRTETLACAGNNCGFTCAPLQPGRRYRVYGLWVPDDGGALYVAGSCAD